MRLLLYGAREFARTVAELARHCGHEVAGLVDDRITGPRIVGTLEQAAHSHPPGDYGLVLAIGYNDLPGRWAAWHWANTLGYRAPCAPSPTCLCI
ncbi:MAG: hypothetical protein NZ524_06935 [Thiobacillaceae bacterium]|nr:hypothetical protein [Thiobacillaceae bacterium]